MKHKKILILSLVAAFLLLVFVLAIRVNRMYPQGKEILFAMNEPIEFGEDVTITVNEAKFLSSEEKELYCTDFHDKGIDYECIVISVTAENHGQSEAQPEIYPMMLESGAFANGNNLFTFMAMNEDSENRTLHPALKSGESTTVWIPFSLAELHFKPKDWKTVKERDYKLVFNLYPQKKSIVLDVKK